RVGYGKGYYDRTLAALKEDGHEFVSIGIAWATGDLSELGHVPHPHDCPLDGMVTDKGWAVPAPTLEWAPRLSDKQTGSALGPVNPNSADATQRAGLRRCSVWKNASR